MTIIFDGRKYAFDKKIEIEKRVGELKEKEITPKLVSIIVGDDPASILYVNLKKKRAEEVGIQLSITNYQLPIEGQEIVNDIKKLNEDESVHGIMVQLPLPANIRLKTEEIISAIAKEKDVDGLRNDSPFLHPTSKAVLEILEEALKIVRPMVNDRPLTVTVVGATGMVGRPLVYELKNPNSKFQIPNGNKFEVIECDSKTEDLKLKTKDADVVISATGVFGIIKSDMVNDGVILIDVGSPNGDIEKEAYNKASFVSPVPGGVGPVTIMCLLENLVESTT